VRKLLASPYELIISGPCLAEMDDFLFLKRTQTLETSVPLVVTADASEKPSARRVLLEGALDLITNPLDHEQTVSTIRLALWHNKLTALIARKEHTLDKYRQHVADYPAEKRMEEAFTRTLTNGPFYGLKKVRCASPTLRRN
jgi:DNA-binding NtrC family response regulator